MTRRLFALGSYDRGELGLVWDDVAETALLVDSGGETDLGAGGGGAPTNADYLVGTPNAGLSSEIVVGATPGGELGGTWAAPTVDASHSGSTHAAVQAAAEATAAGALTTHTADTTAVHGIADTSVLETTSGAQAKVDVHTGDATAAHAATAVSADSTTLVGTGTDVQAVLEELDNGIADHLADTTAAHAASAISYGGAAGLSATDVEAALDELDTEKSATGHTHTDLVSKSLFDANTVLAADTDDTPAALTMGASTILARLAAGNIKAATPAELRTLLALVIGTNVQAWDADLDSIAALTTTAYGRSLLEAANAAALRTLAGLVIGTDVPAFASTVLDGDAAGGDLTGTYPSPTLATAGPGATGPIGSSSTTPVVTIDAKGRVTALTSAAIAGPTLPQALRVQAADETITADYGIVIVDEYVMDATHELIFSDPSEMAVI